MDADAARALIAAEAFLGRSEDHSGVEAYPQMATAAALVSIAYSLIRVADALAKTQQEPDSDA